MRAMKSEAIDLTLAAAGSKVTYGGAAVTGIGWLLSNQFFSLMGLVFTLFGVGITWYYKRKANHRMEQEFALRREEIKLRMDLMRQNSKIIPDPSCPMVEPAE